MNNRFFNPIVLSFFVFSSMIFLSCQNKENQNGQRATNNSEVSDEIKFEQLAPTATGIDFSNNLNINDLKITLDYINVYNGGGVAAGDINNDGLVDLYFTGNQVDNKLYLNKGNFQFEDISVKAGITSPNSWSTGVTMADVNNDGWLDIYVCRAYYDGDVSLRENQLYINNGDLTFTNRATEYGLNDSHYSIQASFLDYDRDGLLDLFVGNHPRQRNKDKSFHANNFNNPEMIHSDQLYRNNGNGTFSNVTEKAGILNYGWTLGISITDYNKDGWPDIYVAVDHTEPDYFYQNNGDGTFTNVVESKLKHITASSMGMDAADINNDGNVDMYVVDMLQTDNFRQKTQMGSMEPERFWELTKSGYHYQYMRNQLQLNTGNNSFVDIGQMAGVHQTDWSWAALLADLNNNGWKDLYISNGYYRDVLDKDQIYNLRKKFFLAEQQNQNLNTIAYEHARNLGTTKSRNFCFANNKDLTFSDVSSSSGLDHLGYSNGALYADFDNDGQLDIVANNIDETSYIYKNISGGKNNYLRFKFDYSPDMHSIGAKVIIKSGDQLQYQELYPTRGYQSMVEPLLHFGLGQLDEVDYVIIKWPDGKTQKLNSVSANQMLLVKYQDANLTNTSSDKMASYMFRENKSIAEIDFKHKENEFDDYSVQILLPHKMSQFGPFITKGDVNDDGLEDFFVGGAAGQSGVVFIQKADGNFKRQSNSVFSKDKDYEDMQATFFDADNDGDMDLFVVSGGSQHPVNSPLYYDRLYLNNGSGNFKTAQDQIPNASVSGSCVKPFDYDNDGDIDLFVGGRHVPHNYPSPAPSRLLENQGGKFLKVKESLTRDFYKLGMVTDAIWTDFDADGSTDLVVVGEWMPITVILNKDGNFVKSDNDFGIAASKGWWNTIEECDLDKDGDMDYVIGNLGLNYKYQGSVEKPFHVYAGDFDSNGTFDIALGYVAQDQIFPVRGRQCSSEQMPSLAKKFPTYTAFGSASLEDVYGVSLQNALHLEANNFNSSILLNKGNGQYTLKTLPNEAQLSPVNAIVCHDFDKDGNMDIMLGGNLYVSEVETGRADAGTGLLLKGDGNGNFIPKTYESSGFYIPGDVKDLDLIQVGNKSVPSILVANNDAPMQLFELDAM